MKELEKTNGTWIINNAGGEIQFSITSCIVDLGFQLNSFGVYWGNRSLFGAQNIGDSESIDLLGEIKRLT